MKVSLLVTLVVTTTTAVDASTRVVVLEFGKGGTVRRTTSTDPETSVQGVASFWNALHPTNAKRRQLQHAGMSVVPDLFNKAASSVVIGLSGKVDVDAMPNVGRFISAQAVGTMEVLGGHHCSDMMSRLQDVETVEDITALKDTAAKQTEKDGLTAVSVQVDSSNAKKIDAELNAVLQQIQKQLKGSDRTIVVHIVVDEDEEVGRRRLESRQLADDGNYNNANGNNNNNANGNNNNANGNQYSGYYGYGYYNSFGEWITPYKTMFQIQYFNVVLWTAIGLMLALIYSVYLMTSMPLEPDTLLFGVTAKMIGDD
jgi:hypothetical protein